jgi:hypothetical protein
LAETKWIYKKGDLFAFRVVLINRDPEMLDQLILAAIFEGATTEEIDEETKELLRWLTPEVQEWWREHDAETLESERQP